MAALRPANIEMPRTPGFEPFDTQPPVEREDKSSVRRMRKACVLFHGCSGDFWERTILKIREPSTFTIKEAPLEHLDRNSHDNYVVVFGFHSKEPCDLDIERMVGAIRETNARLGDRVKILCVVPRNGELQKRLLDTGAADVVSTKETDLQWAKVIGEHIQHLIHDFDESEPLTHAIVCRGSEDSDILAKKARSHATMDSFAGETVTNEAGEKEEIRKYAYHMKITGHEDARNLAISHMRGSLGSRIIVPGCGEGHPIRVMTRNILIPEVLAGRRSDTFIIGIDKLEKMVRWSNEGFKTLRSQNRSDFTKGRIPDIIIPDVIDMHHIHMDLFEVGMDAISDIKMGRPRTPFGEADTIILEYIAQWNADKMDLVRWASKMGSKGTRVLLLEEHELKVTPSIFIRTQDAQNISTNTWPFRQGVEEYYTLWESNGFRRIYQTPIKVRIDPAHIDEKDAHYVYGMVMVKE